MGGKVSLLVSIRDAFAYFITWLARNNPIYKQHWDFSFGDSPVQEKSALDQKNLPL